MQIELWPLDRITPHDKNPRLNDDAVDAVARSIREFGFRQPIVVDEDGVVIIGHTRLKAAKQLGLGEVPVHVARGLSPEKIKALRIADNKTAEIAEWNLELLPIELAELQGMDFDLGLLGFDQVELAKLLDPGVQEGLCNPDEIPAPPDEAITRPGIAFLCILKVAIEHAGRWSAIWNPVRPGIAVDPAATIVAIQPDTRCAGSVKRPDPAIISGSGLTANLRDTDGVAGPVCDPGKRQSGILAHHSAESRLVPVFSTPAAAAKVRGIVAARVFDTNQRLEADIPPNVGWAAVHGDRRRANRGVAVGRNVHSGIERLIDGRLFQHRQYGNCPGRTGIIPTIVDKARWTNRGRGESPVRVVISCQREANLL
jgi:hypothetical protein